MTQRRTPSGHWWERLETRRFFSGTTALWTGAAGNGLWSDADNWQGNSVPAAGQDVEFSNLTGSNPPQIVQVDQAVETGSITLDNTILQGSPAITIDGDVTVGISNYAAIIAPINLTHTTTLNVSAGTGAKYSDLLLCDPIADGGRGDGLTITGGGEVDIVPCTIQNGDASYSNSDVAETYTGPTVVTGGSVLTINANGASDISASGDGEVFGSGTSPKLSEDASQFGATDLYGFFPDVLTVADGAHFNAGSLFTEQINGPSVGDGTTSHGSSELDVRAGTIDLGGATLNGNVDTTYYTPRAGDVITVIRNQTGHAIGGTFANLPEGSHLQVNGFPFVISYHGGSDGQDVTLTDPTTPTVSERTSSQIVTGRSAILHAVGADPAAAAGESGLIYSWTAVSMPTGARVPLIAGNGTNAAETADVRFYKAGTYHFRCTVTNAVGNSATTMVRLVVAQSPKLIRLNPHAEQLDPGSRLQFGGVLLDQFNHIIRSAPAINFSIAFGAGSVTDAGLFSSDDQIRGHVAILGEDDGVSGEVCVTVR